MPVPTKITDHVARALALQLSQWANSARLRELTSIIATEIQRLEDVAWDVLQGRMLATAQTAALAMIGKIVNLARLDTDTDDEYRQLLGAAVAAQESSGSSDAVARVASACVDEAVHVYWDGPAHARMDYVTDSGISDRHAERTADLIDRAMPPGVAWDLTEGSSIAHAMRLNSSRLGSGRLGRTVARRV